MIETLTTFFMWCTLLNLALLLVWTAVFMMAPDFVYRLQTRWFPIPRETYNVIIYSFLGLFKVLFIVFSVIPWLALLIIG